VDSKQIRERYLRFYEERGHRRVKSSSLVPNDQTLLLTNAGMVQFKPYFLGLVRPEFSRATTAQKCFRTTDIDIIGRDGTHLTFFEMMGNFSFGDYYKKEAISWAWELITQEFGLNREKLWITVFKDDDETYSIWNEKVGVSSEQIAPLDEKTNFWNMGPTGPCGPCSEIHYDQGVGVGCGKPDCSVSCECDRFIEIWNLVFMQYNRKDDGTLEPLPRKNIDTGLGLERMAAVMQGKIDVFRTDVFSSLMDTIQNVSNMPYGESGRTDRSLRIICDHSRSVSFLIADGVLPSNEGRGYILRRMLRRAVRHGVLLEIKKPFMEIICDEVTKKMGKFYPELVKNRDTVLSSVRQEEQRFLSTLKQGNILIEEEIASLKKKWLKVFPGEVAFKLYDTFGFPLELTEEISADNELKVDVDKFNRLMLEQKERARKSAEFVDERFSLKLRYMNMAGLEKTKFVGYHDYEIESEVRAILKSGQRINSADTGEEVEVILDRTPFYAGRGGQVADRGKITANGVDADVVEVITPEQDIVLHITRVVTGSLKVGEKVRASIDINSRLNVQRNHTATHLLHAALREVLGPSVKQAGSLVTPQRLRFDLSFHRQLKNDEIAAVEDLVNEKIMEGLPVKTYDTTLEFATELGAIALFDEKYGEYVRVVEVGDYSRELCGGTHVSNSAELGLFKIINEEGIGSNTRRIDALTGKGVLGYLRGLERSTRSLSSIFKVGEEGLVTKSKSLFEELKMKDKEILKLQSKIAASKVQEIFNSAVGIGNMRIFSGTMDSVSFEILKRSSIDLLSRARSGFVALGSNDNGRVIVLLSATDDLTDMGIDCSIIAKDIASIIDGGGGGNKNFAQIGGKTAGALEQCVKAAADIVIKSIGTGK
jgi:alanyl-tRNA synthetase